MIGSFTIITTEANKRMSENHHRMPVIIGPDNFDQWLIEGDGKLLTPCLDDVIDTYKVSSQVNKPGNDGIKLILPI